MAFLPVPIQAVLTTALLSASPWPVHLEGFGSSEQEKAIGRFMLGEFWLFPVIALVSLALYAAFSVTWHRRVLVPEERPRAGDALSWGWPQSRFFLRVCLLLVLYGLTAFVLVNILNVLVSVVETDSPETAADFPLLFWLPVLGLLIAGMPYCRFMLRLPAAAVGVRLGLTECWRLTRGNTWRLLWIMAVPTIVFLLLIGRLDRTIDWPPAAIGQVPTLAEVFLYNAAAQFIAHAGLAVTVTAVSIAFRNLVTPPAEAAGT